MKIKWGALVVDGRGKLGGHVASKNADGNYLRTKTTPTNPQTSYQTAVRALFGAISQGWSALTQAQRDAWNSAVELWQTTDVFGDLKKPTGKALYQRLNNQAQSAGLSAVTDPPAKQEMPDDVVTAVAIDSTADTITLTGANASASTQVVVFATTQLTAGTKFVKNKLRQVYAVAGNSFVAADCYTGYANKFGDTTAGDNIYIGVKYVLSNGQASPLQIIKATVS